MKNSNCIIITQKEWLNWLAFGYLRISPSRISYFDTSESSFNILMSHSVDHALDEEDAYLIASLVNDYSREELHVKRTPFSDYISIQAVQGFYTLSIKGRDLLEHEMEQSHSILHCDSKIENLWSEWKNIQLTLRNHEKGNKFLEILDYQKFEVEQEIDNENLFSQTLKNYTRNRLIEDLKDLSNNNSFAWFFTNYQFSKTDENTYGHYKKLRKSSKNIEFKNLSNTYITQNSKYLAKENGYLVDNPSLIAEKIFFDRISNSKNYFLATSFLVHYYNLLDNNLEINLSFLKVDLSFLDAIYYPTKDISQLIAYFIGRRLNEVYLNSLYIAKKIDSEKLGMFDTNFFSNKKKEKLTLFHSDPDQLRDTINKVKFIAEEIHLAYNKEVNNVQVSKIGSDPIEEKDGDPNQSMQSQPMIVDNSNIENNNILSKEKEDIPSNITNDDPTEPHSDVQNPVDCTNSIATKNEDFNEHNDNPKLSSHTQLNPSEKEYPIDSSDKPESITETDSKSDNSHLEKSNQPDSAYFKELALAIYSELSSEEKKKASPFIKKFNEHLSDSGKNKLRSKEHNNFFRDFGELIGDIKTYQNIKYNDFKSILNRKFEPVSGEQAELQLNGS